MWLKVIFGVILLFVGFYLIGYFKLKRLQAKQKQDFLKVFGSLERTLPKLDFGSAYGWDTFTVTFQNQDDFGYATENGLIEEFKKCLRAYYGSDFNVDLASHFTYKGKPFVFRKVAETTPTITLDSN